jgi:hypothetical protein
VAIPVLGSGKLRQVGFAQGVRHRLAPLFRYPTSRAAVQRAEAMRRTVMPQHGSEANGAGRGLTARRPQA